jgi:phosphoribosylformylglycinamidine synthase PurS subunit
MIAKVQVMLKNGVLDPQGEAVRHALGTLGFDGVQSVRQGKIIEVELDDVELDGGDKTAARAKVTDMCEKLLANTVIESYSISID